MRRFTLRAAGRSRTPRALRTILTDDLREALEDRVRLREYYRGVHDDIETAPGSTPSQHYFLHGMARGSRSLGAVLDVVLPLFQPRRRCGRSSTRWLHHRYPTVHRPREGRRPSSSPRRDCKRQTVSPSFGRSTRRSPTGSTAWLPRSTPLDGVSFMGRSTRGPRIGTRRHVVLSCGHDNYTKIVGGVQLCVALEQAAFAERDCAYINLHPVRPLPVLSPETEPEALTLAVPRRRRRRRHCHRGLAVIAALAGVAGDQGVDFGLVVHALHGHSPEVIAELHSRLAPRWAWLWLHDYFGICPSATLLRNRIEPCGAPKPESPGCTICVFGEERLRHLPRFHALLDRVPFKLVAPSQFMADRWKLYFGREELDITVHEIGALTEAPAESGQAGPSAVTAEGPARVAFLGAPAVHKGWDVFQELVRRNAASGNYRFYHFGDGRYRGTDIERHEVNVVENDPLAVVDALRQEGVDVAALWSLWEESFSFTAHEAQSAGAAILTSESSGNIARVVEISGAGLVFADEHELFAAFESGSILDFVRSRRAAWSAPADFVHPG